VINRRWMPRWKDGQALSSVTCSSASSAKHREVGSREGEGGQAGGGKEPMLWGVKGRGQRGAGVVEGRVERKHRGW
jgi:hypothetical protein